MKSHSVEFGERYSDNSGWERRLLVNLQEKRIEIDSEGSYMSMMVDEMEWLIRALMAAREALGMDKIISEVPTSSE